MDLGLKDKVVLVAGASKGIGFAVAQSFAKEGAKVAICSRDEERIQIAGDLIRQENAVDIFAKAVDVTNQAEVNAWVKDTYEKFGAVHVCISNAGGPPSVPFIQTTPESWQDAIQLTFMSVIYLSQAVIPIMKAQSWGRILHICSASVRNPIPHLGFSNAIRSAVVALGKTQANELAQDGILVNSILPGWTDTERVAELTAAKAKHMNISVEEAISTRKLAIPVRRMATPEEIADPIVFLASERASFITGTAITIDGGETKYPF